MEQMVDLSKKEGETIKYTFPRPVKEVKKRLQDKLISHHFFKYRIMPARSAELNSPVLTVLLMSAAE